MKMLRIAWLLVLLLGGGGVVAQQVSCGTIAPSSVNGTYTPTTALGLTGSIALTCTRNAGPKDRSLWLGIDNGPGTPARNLDRIGGGAFLPYGIFRNPGNTGSWTTGPGQPLGSATAGGTLVDLDFTASNTVSVTVNYHLQILAGQYVAAGNYSDNPVTLTVRLETDTGTQLGTASFIPSVRVQDFCRLATPPANMALNYTSFSAGGANASTTFGVQCLRGTPYTIALDATTGNALGLTYTLNLSSTGSTGNGLEQTHAINGAIAPGQPGTCALASCSATHTRTLTITY